MLSGIWQTWRHGNISENHKKTTYLNNILNWRERRSPQRGESLRGRLGPHGRRDRVKDARRMRWHELLLRWDGDVEQRCGGIFGGGVSGGVRDLGREVGIRHLRRPAVRAAPGRPWRDVGARPRLRPWRTTMVRAVCKFTFTAAAWTDQSGFACALVGRGYFGAHVDDPVGARAGLRREVLAGV